MRWTVFIIAILFSCMSVMAQETDIKQIRGRGYIGYVIPKDNFVEYFDFHALKTRITPTQEQIKRVETILKDSVEQVVGGLGPNIKKRILGRYHRQYIGFVNNKGETIIYINLVKAPNKEVRGEMKKELYWVLDGEDDYWQIYINIDTKELFGLSVNGPG